MRVRSMSPVDLGRPRHFVRCRLWSRARKRVTLAKTFARLKRLASVEASSLAAEAGAAPASIGGRANDSTQAEQEHWVETSIERPDQFPYGGASLAEALFMLRRKVNSCSESSDTSSSSSDQGTAPLVVVDCNTTPRTNTGAEACTEGVCSIDFEVDVEEWLKLAAALEKARREKVIAKAKADQNVLRPKWFQPSVW